MISYRFIEVFMKLVFALLLGIFLTAHGAFAQEFLPSNILQMDEQFSHHVILVEKSTHKLYVYQNDQNLPKLVKTYQVATGKIRGNKFVQGDHKTPEGIYQFLQFHAGEDLVKRYGEYGNIYGAGAFTLNYPNLMDKRAGKTGGGIWLHSTDDASRISKGLDSRGCVVANDEDLKDISKFIDLGNTSVIVVENANYLKKETWQNEKEEISKVINDWANAWANKDFETYISQYSSKEFYNRFKGDFSSYRNYKRAIFSRNEVPIIHFSNFSILAHKDYVIAMMKQNYSSQLVKDIGKKILYLKKDDNYKWKIVAEEWKKISEDNSIAFTPSMRFFQAVTKDSEI